MPALADLLTDPHRDGSKPNLYLCVRAVVGRLLGFVYVHKMPNLLSLNVGYKASATHIGVDWWLVNYVELGENK